MITIADLQTLVNERLTDAETLFNAQRFDGAVYVCGYAIEIALKRKICLTLGWIGFPSDSGEFKGLTCLKVHDLDVLLKFSGVEVNLKSQLFADWSNVSKWNPESRYKLTGTVTPYDADEIIQSAKAIIAFL